MMRILPRGRSPRRSLTVAVCLVPLLVGAGTATAAAPPPRTFAAPTGVDRSLLRGDGPKRVLVVLAGRPGGASAPTADQRAALGRRLPMATVRAFRRARDTRGLLELRAERYASAGGVLARHARAAALEHAPLVRRLEAAGLGGMRIDLLAGNVEGSATPRVVSRIARIPGVRAVVANPAPKPLGLAETQVAVGAPSAWAAGFTGGSGPSDVVPVNVGIHEVFAVASDHPAFAGLRFQRPPRTPSLPGCSEVRCRHATAVASVMVAKGASGCAVCVPADVNEKGTAPGVASLLESTFVTGLGAFSPFEWLAGITQTDPSSPSNVLPGATDPADVLNVSLGVNTNGADDLPQLQMFDRAVERTGIPMVVAAGNTPNQRLITAPALAYNAIAVGGLDTRNGANMFDDTLATNSSVGPSPGGRRKPDLVAAAASTVAESRWRDVGKLWDFTAGTSFAAATTTGAAALLLGSGVSDPIAIKAVLVNSARPGRATPSSAVGTQVGWQPDWGWGQLDAKSAIAQRNAWAAGTVPSDGPRFFRMAAQATDKATLVWQRRGVGCGWLTCQNQSYTLSDLDLSAYAPDGTALASSASRIDNVEQVRLTSSGDTLLKVRARTAVVGDPKGEPFALAGTRALVPVAPPTPTVAVAPAPSTVPAGGTSVVSATVRNGGDVAATASATLATPEGVALADGSPATQSGGLLAPGASTVLTWTVRGATPGTHVLDVRATTTALDETFTGTGSGELTVSG